MQLWEGEWRLLWKAESLRETCESQECPVYHLRQCEGRVERKSDSNLYKLAVKRTKKQAVSFVTALNYSQINVGV